MKIFVSRSGKETDECAQWELRGGGRFCSLRCLVFWELGQGGLLLLTVYFLEKLFVAI